MNLYLKQSGKVQLSKFNHWLQQHAASQQPFPYKGWKTTLLKQYLYTPPLRKIQNPTIKNPSHLLKISGKLVCLDASEALCLLLFKVENAHFKTAAHGLERPSGKPNKQYKEGQSKS